MSASVNEAEPKGTGEFGGGNSPAQSPQIVILGVAGSNPVSHPSPFGSAGNIDAEIRLDEPISEYHQDAEYRNASRVKTFLDSSRLYWRRYLAPTPLPSPTSTSLEFGTLLHQWFEEGDALLGRLASPPPQFLTATGLVGKEGKKWAAENLPAGGQLVSPSVMDQLRQAIDAVRGNQAATRLMDRVVHREASVRWTHLGHKLRCRFDQVTSDGLVVDLKTTSDADILHDWWRSVLKWKYHFSEAWYRCGAQACGLPDQPLRYIVVSTVPPHDCHVVTLPWDVVAEGRRLMDAALTDLQVREDLGWWDHESHGEEVELTFPSYATRGF